MTKMDMSYFVKISLEINSSNSMVNLDCFFIRVVSKDHLFDLIVFNLDDYGPFSQLSRFLI
ncbi:hypothetical protein VRK_40850 [Vibrio sp. MEBiC08052]|nr:hypothetical protein VRK_40850 [Vibrio sp. MEBiC08052]